MVEEQHYMNNFSCADIIGFVMYVMVYAYIMSIVTRFIFNPKQAYEQTLKWILCYLKGSLGRVLVYGGLKQFFIYAPIKGFVDSDHVRCFDTIKFHTCYIFTAHGIAITWKANLQRVEALSTIEVEYIAMTKAVNETL